MFLQHFLSEECAVTLAAVRCGRMRDTFVKIQSQLTVEGLVAWCAAEAVVGILLMLLELLWAVARRTKCLTAMRHDGVCSKDLYDDEGRSVVCGMCWWIVVVIVK